ncbi:condensin-2 complex subunit D3-L-like [Haemaphysalis longicornis]
MDADESYDLVSRTLTAFTDLPIDLLDQEWINKVWDNRYTDAELADVDLLESCEGNSYALMDALSSACEYCQKWSCFSDTEDEEGDENTDDKLWQTLMDNGVHYKSLLALVYLGIGQGNASGATIEKKKIALRFAKLYFNLVLVPGSSAYRIFQESLFQAAVQCFRLPNKSVTLNSDAAGNKSSQSGSVRGSGRGGRRKQSVNSSNDNSELDSSEVVETEVWSAQMLVDFVSSMTESLRDLVWMLQAFKLRSYIEVTEFLIQHLSDLVALDIPGANLSFSINLEYRNCHYRQLPTYAYCALKLLCLPQHGEPADSFCAITKCLMPHILMLAAGNAQSVSRPLSNIRDNAISFLCHVMETCDDEVRDSFEEVIIILIHNVSFHAIDRTDFRLKTTQAVHTLMAVLNEERFQRVIQWFIKLTMVPLSNRRVFALDMILALIWDKRVSTAKCSDLLLAAMKRCNDKAATVKTKALSVLASVTSYPPEHWVPLLRVSNPVEPADEGDGVQVAVEDDRLAQLMVMLKYRAEDPKVNVRKAALSLLQNVLCASGDFIKQEYVEILKESCLDLALLVRKQALQALTRCLQAHPQEALLLRLWLAGALPLVLDAENSVMEKAVEAVDMLILEPLCRPSQGADTALGWRLLAQVSQGPFREHHKYLQQAVLQLHRGEKIRTSQLHHLKSHVGGPNDASVWLLLSKLALCCDIGQGNFALSYWKQQWEGERGPSASTETLNHVLAVLRKVSRQLPQGAVRELIGDLEAQLQQLSLPTEIIPAAVECLHSLKRSVQRERPEVGERAVETWCKQALDKCQAFLSEALAAGGDLEAQEEQLVRHLVLLGEAAQPAPRAVSRQLHQLVQSCFAGVEDEGARRKSAGRRSLRGGGRQSRGGGCPQVTRLVRAHAVIVMGILSLQNETLAKSAVPTMGNALASSTDPMMRANLVVVLTDMCKRYAVLVDPYLPVVTRCLKDPVRAIRSLVLTCLLQLLQQDFVKLHGRLFYRLLSALTDQEAEVRELAEFGLVECVGRRLPHIFYQRFVECMCYLNSYSGGGQAEGIVETSERDRRLFGAGREERLALYRFLLLNMPDEDRFKLTLALTQSVLMPCAEEPGPTPGMEEQCPEMLHDALWVLCSEEIKLQTIATAAEEAAQEEDPNRAALQVVRRTVLSNVVRVNLVENVIPVVIALKNKLEAAQSPLLRWLLMFLRDLMRDYKAEAKDMLAADKKLASEVAFDLRRLEREEEEEAAALAVNNPTTPSRTPGRAPNAEMQELLDTARKLREEAVKRRSIIVLPEVADAEAGATENGAAEAENRCLAEVGNSDPVATPTGRPGVRKELWMGEDPENENLPDATNGTSPVQSPEKRGRKRGSSTPTTPRVPERLRSPRRRFSVELGTPDASQSLKDPFKKPTPPRPLATPKQARRKSSTQEAPSTPPVLHSAPPPDILPSEGEPDQGTSSPEQAAAVDDEATTPVQCSTSGVNQDE